jgi:hypothetical protein
MGLNNTVNTFRIIRDTPCSNKFLHLSSSSASMPKALDTASNWTWLLCIMVSIAFMMAVCLSVGPSVLQCQGSPHWVDIREIRHSVMFGYRMWYQQMIVTQPCDCDTASHCSVLPWELLCWINSCPISTPLLHSVISPSTSTVCQYTSNITSCILSFEVQKPS